MTRCTSIVMAAAMILAADTGLAQTARAPVATTPHFAFFSDFATNLHDALITAANARRRMLPELFRQGVEKACFDALPAAERAAWTGGVDYYAAIVAPFGYQLRNDVGLLAEGFDVHAERLAGNFPQAGSHVGLVNTAMNLSARKAPATERAEG